MATITWSTNAFVLETHHGTHCTDNAFDKLNKLVVQKGAASRNQS